MERKFASLCLPDTGHKLTRAVSFSELPTARRVLIEQHYQSENCDGLIRQYSCEHIFDKTSNTSHIKVSQVVKPVTDKINDLWKTPIPIVTFTESWPPKDSNKSYTKIDQTNEYMNYLKIANNQNKLTEKPTSCSLVPMNTNNCKLDEDIKRLSISQCNSRRSISSCSSLSKGSSSERIANKTELNRENEKVNNDINNVINIYSKPDLNKSKKKLRSLIPEQSTKMKTFSYFWPVLFFLLLPITVIFISVTFTENDLVKQVCYPVMDFHNAVIEIQEHIYGQKNAVLELTEFLYSCKSGFYIVALVGGTGVGKSYTASIIKQNLGSKHFAFEFFPPLYEKDKDAYKTLSTCGCSVLILDNLKADDILDTVTFSKILKSRAKSYCILVIAIFNTQEVNINLSRKLDLKSSVNNIKKEFQKHDLEVKVIAYDTLSTEALVHCIKKAAEYSNTNLSDQDVKYIMHGLEVAESGCKGAYSKVIGKDRLAK